MEGERDGRRGVKAESRKEAKDFPGHGFILVLKYENNSMKISIENVFSQIGRASCRERV